MEGVVVEEEEVRVIGLGGGAVKPRSSGAMPALRAA